MTSIIAFVAGALLAPFVSEVPVVKQIHAAIFAVVDYVRLLFRGPAE